MTFSEQELADDLEGLIKELNSIKALEKATKERETRCKDDIERALQALGADSCSCKHGSIRRQTKITKVYGEAVIQAENQYKSIKGLADDLGDYEEKPGATSIVFNFPKES